MPSHNPLRLLSIRIVFAALVSVALVFDARGQDATPSSGRASFRSELQNIWSLQPVTRPAVPPAQNSKWVQNPIDGFVLARLEGDGLKPAAQANKVQLIRRVTLDLIGLPPTPEEVDAFLADDRANAYELLVDRLLGSQQYGERWARPWLDLSRYAESDGFKSDNTRPHAWRFRDYVIRSLNDDMPYDRFIREQLAGDEIDPDNASALIATGFNRHWADEDNARNLVLRRQEILNDMTDTTASVFLGLSLGCARCHDHKYDPITQRDYYRFQAFFAAAQPVDSVAVTDGDATTYYRRITEWEQATAEIRGEIASIEDPVRSKMKADTIEKFVPEVQEALSTEPGRRTPLQHQFVNLAETHMDISTESMMSKMAKDDRDRWSKLRESLKDYDGLKPPVPAQAMALADVGRAAPETYVLRRGVYNSPEEKVEPGILSFFDPNPLTVTPPGRASTGRRTALADWIANPANPLSARVMVNRLWQGHFGHGLVATPSDFGMQGEPPTHPELLDWLASEFVERGWSLKAMHRLMVTSNTYRQSTQGDDASAARAAEIDPDNRLLWHMNRSRLDAEIIRDSMLAVCGQLNPQIGGPSVRPELPAGLSDRYGWKTDTDPTQRNRRSVYVFVRRNLRYPLFELFDMPDTNETCGRRNRTTTPPQALFILNSELILNHARAMAGRVYREAGPDQYAIVTRSYRLAFGRDPSGEDMNRATQFLREQSTLIRDRTTSTTQLALPDPMPEQLDVATGAALTDLCHALLNANEFIYVD
jgi:hypothetical protein